MLPIIENGNQPIYYVGIHDLVLCIHKLIMSDNHGIFTICNPNPIDYKSFYQTVSDYLKITLILIPIPIWILKIGLQFLSLFPNSNFNSDNLKGLLEVPNLENEIENQNELKNLNQILEDF